MTWAFHHKALCIRRSVGSFRHKALYIRRSASPFRHLHFNPSLCWTFPSQSALYLSFCQSVPSPSFQSVAFLDLSVTLPLAFLD
ncbi:hypothetical protein ABH966_001728 [Lysinibacillus sp. RC46]|uniref:hypothetical protein n=1 Tax=Lysinibacillus sp. RC46 TaxID=3156295 RepID=UPI003517C0C8